MNSGESVKNFFKQNQNLYESFLIPQTDEKILPYVSLSGYNELCDCILYMDLLNTIEKAPGGGAGASMGSQTKRSPKKKVNLDELIESLTPEEITTLREKLGYNDTPSRVGNTPPLVGPPPPPVGPPPQEQITHTQQKYHLRYILSILFSFFIGILIMWCKQSFNNTGYNKLEANKELNFQIEKIPLSLSPSLELTFMVNQQPQTTLAGHIYDYIDNAYNPTQLDTSSCTIKDKEFKKFSPFEKTFIRNTEIFQTYIEYRAFLVDNTIVLMDTPPPQGAVTTALTSIKEINIETTITKETLNTLYENFNKLFKDGNVAPLQFIKNIAHNHDEINPITKMKFLRLHETIVRWKEDIYNEVPVHTTNPCEQGGNLQSNAIFIKMHQMGFVQRMVNHYVRETTETLDEFKEDFGPFFQTLIATKDDNAPPTNIIELNNKLNTALEGTTSIEIKRLFAKPKAVLDEYNGLKLVNPDKAKEAIEKIKYMMIQTFPTFEKSVARARMIDTYKGYISNALFMSGKFTGTTAYQIVHGISKAENDAKAGLPQIMEDISFEILESIDKSIIRSYDINALNHISAKMFSSIGQKLISSVLPIYKDAFSINFMMDQINGLTSVGYGNSVGTVLNIFHSAIIRLNAEKEIHLLRMKDPISYIDMLKKFYELSQTKNENVPQLLHGSTLEYVDMMLKISKLDIAIGVLKLQYDILNTAGSTNTFEHLSMVGHPDIFGQHDNKGLAKYAPFFVEKGSHIMALIAYSSSFTSDNLQTLTRTGGKKLENKLINAFIENAEANHKPTMNKLTSKKQINATLKKKLFNSLMKSNPRLFKSIKEYESSVV